MLNSNNNNHNEIKNKLQNSEWPQNVGIISMDLYFPNLFVNQTELEKYDNVQPGKYTLGLGQHNMAFCDDVEDIQSICLTVLKNLLEKTCVSPKEIGFLMVGTETIIDKSKSIKTFLMQLFEEYDNTEIEGLDTKNACYGGTSALFHAINWIESSSWDGRYAIVVCGDLAFYEPGPARPTGGVAACAMLIGPNAPLTIVRGAKSTYMSNVYDFYKPNLSSNYPIVDGKLSISCYLKSLDKCYQLFKKRFEANVAKKKIDLDYFDGLIFHSPFCKLVQKSVARLLFNEFMINISLRETYKKYENFTRFFELKLEETYFDRDLEKTFLDLSKTIFDKKTKPSLYIASQIGNTYTASLYSCLISYLISKPIEEISGKNLLLFSYGSGLAASMFSISISSDCSTGSPLYNLINIIKPIHDALIKRVKKLPCEFVRIMHLREQIYNLMPYEPFGNKENLVPGTYYVKYIDHKRTYDRFLDHKNKI